jgi:hypothetical protein
MSYFIAAISNGGGAPEQAYRKMQAAGACPEKPFAGKSDVASQWIFRGCFGKLVDGAFWGCGLLSILPERALRNISNHAHGLSLVSFFSYLTEMFKFEVPSLTVGTLDTLMVSNLLSHSRSFRWSQITHTARFLFYVAAEFER